jgi:hypothetical protein
MFDQRMMRCRRRDERLVECSLAANPGELLLAGLLWGGAVRADDITVDCIVEFSAG